MVRPIVLFCLLFSCFAVSQPLEAQLIRHRRVFRSMRCCPPVVCCEEIIICNDPEPGCGNCDVERVGNVTIMHNNCSIGCYCPVPLIGQTIDAEGLIDFNCETFGEVFPPGLDRQLDVDVFTLELKAGRGQNAASKARLRIVYSDADLNKAQEILFIGPRARGQGATLRVNVQKVDDPIDGFRTENSSDDPRAKRVVFSFRAANKEIVSEPIYVMKIDERDSPPTVWFKNLKIELYYLREY